MRRSSVALILAMGSAALAQVPPTLADYLKVHPEEAGLTVGAERRKVLPTGLGLSRYDRKRVRVGGLWAVVPLTMVRFDDSPKKPPNLYDGLPRDAKVLYLMSTLTAAQWQAAGGTGVGLGDLRGEQREVFLSLLPKTLRWEEFRVDANHNLGSKTGEGMLDGGDVRGVRLRIGRELQFDLPLEEPPRSYTGRFSFDEAGRPGDKVGRRDDSDESHPSESFGVEVRTVVPNIVKKGDLDTSSLNAMVRVPATTTVGEALGRVGAATGREILADTRVRAMSLSLPGEPIRTGDLLDAVALAVEGTYRRVGGTFILVGDVTGAGTRKLRLILWNEAIKKEVERRKGEWRDAVGASGLASAVKFDPNDPLKPSEALQERMASRKPEDSENQFFPASELSAEQRAFLKREAARTPDQHFRTDMVGVTGELRYRFVLPNGLALQGEGSLGLDWEFRARAPQSAINSDPAIPASAIPLGANRPLAVRLTSVEEAKRAVATARAFGFSELWIDTGRKEILATAVTSGLPTRLFIRPWALAKPRPDSDRTVLGESGSEVAARQATTLAWMGFVAMKRLESWPRQRPLLLDGDSMSPFDPQWSVRRTTIAELARTDGLAGIVLSGVTPRGYEAGDDTVVVGGYDRSLVESWGLGYDERARLAFFRAQGLDPVDLTTDSLQFDVDTDTPFFGPYPPRPLLQVREVYDKWTAFRGKAIATALEGLRADLPNLPVMVDLRRETGSQPPLGMAVLAPWPRGEGVPSYQGQVVPEMPDATFLFSAPSPQEVDAMDDFANEVKSFAPLPKVATAIDLTRVPSSQWDTLLGRWLARR